MRGLSFFELRVLVLMRRAGRCRASELFPQLEEQIGRKIPPSQLYPSLKRMVQAGLVHEEPQEPEPRKGGRTWRVFSLLPRGVAELESVEALFAPDWQNGGCPPGGKARG